MLSPDDACMDDAGDEDVPPSNNVAISIPRYGRAIISPLESASATRRTVLIGIANPIPSASCRIAALMAITSENSFTNGPPLLPGFIAQSVWKNSTLRRSGMPNSVDVLAKFDIIPKATELSRPKGLPTATANPRRQLRLNSQYRNSATRAKLSNSTSKARYQQFDLRLSRPRCTFDHQ